MTTKIQTLIEIISGTKTYSVPNFQRNYSWESLHCQDLWEDTRDTILDDNESKPFFLGMIILLEKSRGKQYEIIDGQQRLTCLWLLIVAGLSVLKDYGSKDETIEILKNRYIQFQDINTESKIKLVLNRNNNGDFKHICNELQVYTKRDKKETENKIDNTFKYWKIKLKSEFKNVESITEFLDKLTNRLMFTVLISDKKWLVYKMFESTNNRGIKLKSSDLIKNYLISCLSKKEDLIEDLDETWWTVITQLHGLEDNSLEVFIRYHHAFSSGLLVTKKEMFKKIKKRFEDEKEQDRIGKIQKYVSDLKKLAPFYAALHNPEDKFWIERNFQKIEISSYLQFFKTFKFKQPFMILMIACYKFNRSDFLKLLKNIYVISIRYNLISGSRASEQERIYAAIAKKIYDEKYSSCQDILKFDYLRTIYPDNTSLLREKFKKLSLYSPKQARHLLIKIESHLTTKNLIGEHISVEHILPKAFLKNESWSSNFDATQSKLVNRLGNMTILGIGQDKLAIKSFSEKKQFYAKSNFLITKKIANFDKWTETEIEDRQKEWSKYLVGIWQIPSFETKD